MIEVIEQTPFPSNRIMAFFKRDGVSAVKIIDGDKARLIVDHKTLPDGISEETYVSQIPLADWERTDIKFLP